MKRKFILSLALVATMCSAVAQIVNPVSWTSKVKMTSENKGSIIFTAKIDDGWHVYSMNNPSDGPCPLSIIYDKSEGVKIDSNIKQSKAPHQEKDEMFGDVLSWWTGTVTLTVDFTVTAKTYNISGNVEYMACSHENCLAPTRESFSFKGNGTATEAVSSEAIEDVKTETAEVADSVSDKNTDNLATDLWAPVDFNNASGDGNPASSASSSLWYIFIACFAGGLLALLTPCVWPMIPLTVSFFLKKSSSKTKSVLDAFIYGISIIVIYLILGILITMIFGASSLNALATNAICNIVFFLLLVVFAISFFGAFEIKLPDSWANKMDQNAERTTGLLSIFFMAFTLTLVSFSCTGPIIGTLLVEAASQGNLFGPAFGMFSFALALAIPFCLFAMFPSLLKEVPKSGGWMNTVKVVLGFIELALSLKFLSVADLAYGWGILDRETFLALWIVIFGLLGMYLLGKIQFSHFGPTKGIGVFRFFLATISLAFTIYLIPGLWGAPLKSVSAFVPPLYTQDFNLYGGEFTEYDDYEEGMKVAEQANRPVLIDFSGYGCVNCRKMEAAVFDNSTIRQKINDNFVLIKLIVDEKKDLPRPILVQENGRTVKLTTYGDRWSYLQRHKFGANSQPYYVVLNNKGELLSGPYSYDESIEKFANFLDKGVNNYKSQNK